MAAAVLSQELLAIFDAHNVPESLRQFLIGHKVLSLAHFACTAASEDKIDASLIAASTLVFGFGERIAIITAWHAARATMAAPSGGPASGRSSAAPDTMPDGAEARLRKLWYAQHKFNFSGNWLVSASLMAKLYKGLITDDTRSLYVPDIRNVKRLCDLSQPTIRPLVITDNAIVPASYDLGACTTHPDFFVRFRAYVASICLCTISTPDW